MHICDTPLASDADNVNVTEVELIYAAVPLIVTDPAGGVVSVGAACVVTLNVSLTPPIVSVAFTVVEYEADEVTLTVTVALLFTEPATLVYVPPLTE